jgi:hypothetical protein
VGLCAIGLERKAEVEPLNVEGPRMLGMVFKAPSKEEKRCDDEDEDIEYHQSGGESVHEILRA